MKKIRYTLYLLLFFNFLFAQDNLSVWDSTYMSEYEEQLHDIKWLPGGNKIIAVGEAQVPNKKSQGVFYVFDAKTGRRLFRNYFGGQREDVLLSATQANDGTYYLVGYTESGKENYGKDGWVIRLSETYQQLPGDFKTGSPGDDKLQHITWDKERNKGVAIGTKKEHSSGYLWQITLSPKGTIEENKEIGDGTSESIAGFLTSNEGDAWAYGTTRKSDISAKNDIWYLNVVPHTSSSNVRILKSKSPENVINGYSMYNGSLVFGGSIDKEAAWIARVDPNDEEDKNEKSIEKESIPDEMITTLSTHPNGSIYAILGRENNSFVLEMDKTFGFMSGGLLLPNTNRFLPKKLLRIAGDQYLCAGTENTRTKSKIRLMALKFPESIADKGNNYEIEIVGGNYSLKCPEWVFEDEDGDGILRAGERGSVRFAVVNVGDKAFVEGTYKIKLITGTEDMEITSETTGFLEYIAPGKSTTIAIGVRSKTKNVGKDALIHFWIEGESGDTCKIPIKMSGTPNSTSYSFLNPPEIRNSKTRDVALDDKQQQLEVLIRTNNPKLKKENLKIKLDGVEISSNKSEPELLEPQEVSGQYEYVFKYMLRDIPQNKQTLTIFNETDNTSSDPVQLRFSGKKPSLHIVSIGPSYNNLKFTAKDARDFAASMYQQIETGFFANVYVDSLIGVHANADAIRDLMEDLSNRYKETYKGEKAAIKSHDYLVIFYSGHGIKINEKFCLEPTGYDPLRPVKTTVKYQDIINDFLDKIECKRFIFIDACLSGAAEKSNNMDLSTLMNWVNETKPGITSISSCSANESSWEYFERDANGKKIETKGNGVFTKALLEAFNFEKVKLESGNSLSVDAEKVMDEDRPLKYISILSLNEYLKKRIPDILKQDPELKYMSQQPKMTIDLQKNILPIYYSND